MTEVRPRAAQADSPSAIRNASLPKSLRGFDEHATRRLLGEVAAVVESLTAERENLRRQVESLQAAPTFPEATAAGSEADESPEALGSAILAAKRAGQELVEAAHEEASQILAAAAAEADRLLEQARTSAQDVERELAHERERLELQRADHERDVGEWSAKLEAERDATMQRARAEAEALLVTQEQRLSELRREEEEVGRLISEKQTQFVAMIQSALAEIAPLVGGDEAGESGAGDLPGALRTRVDSTSRPRGG